MEKLDHLVKAMDELPPFPIKETDLRLFVPLIHQHILPLRKSIEESGQLLRWFELFGLSVVMLPDDQLLTHLSTIDQELGRDLADALFTAHPEAFRSFVQRQQTEIISRLKVKTQTLTLTVEAERIRAEYILPIESAADAVEESMRRIEAIRSWLPIFEEYESDAIMLPFPNEIILKLPRINAHKILTPDVINSPYLLKLNQIWNDALNKRYMADSLYTWQHQWMNLRQQALHFVRSAEQLLEQSLMHKTGSQAYKVNLKMYAEAGPAFLQADRTLRSFPEADCPSTRSLHFEAEQKNMREWASCLSAFINQFSEIILNNTPETRRLAMLNLGRAVYHLAAMQQSFAHIQAATYIYEDTTRLTDEETRWYSRLHRTALFYGRHVAEALFSRIENVQSNTLKYWKVRQAYTLQTLYMALDAFTERTGYMVYKPTAIIEEEWNLRAVIGIDRVDLNEWETESVHVLNSFVFLTILDIPFYTIVVCQEGIATFAFRLHKSLLDNIVAEMNGEELPNADPDLPYELPITDEDLAYLPVIMLKEQSTQTQHNSQTIYNLFVCLWQLTEYRNRLAVEKPIEKEWWQHISKDLNHQIENYLSALNINIREEAFADIKQFSDQVLMNSSQWTAQNFASQLHKFSQTLL